MRPRAARRKALVAAGKIFSAEGRRDAALEAHDRALKIKGDYMEALVYKGLLLADQVDVALQRYRAEQRITDTWEARERVAGVILWPASRHSNVEALRSLGAAGIPVVLVDHHLPEPELDDPGLRPDGFTIANLPERLSSVGDPWAGMGKHGRSLRKPTWTSCCSAPC